MSFIDTMYDRALAKRLLTEMIISVSRLSLGSWSQLLFRHVACKATRQDSRFLHAVKKARPSTHASMIVTNSQSFLRNASNGAEIFLVGTAHISRRSAKEVLQVIQAVKPDTVFLELCDKRAKKMMDDEERNESFIDKIFEMFSSPPGSIGELFIQAVYKYLEALGFSPGLEFKIALREASALGAKVVLGDQPIDVTMRKMSDAMTFSEILSMVEGRMQPPPREIREIFRNMSDLNERIEAMKKRSVVKMMNDSLVKSNPKIAKILVHERNAYMVDKLYQLKGRVVGVVGLAHLDGIERLWESKQSSM